MSRECEHDEVIDRAGAVRERWEAARLRMLLQVVYGPRGWRCAARRRRRALGLPEPDPHEHLPVPLAWTCSRSRSGRVLDIAMGS